MSEAPADLITDFESMFAREVAFMQYRVLSLSEDGNTAYEVDIKDLTCNCPDDEFNKSGAKVCKHLAKALHVARQNPDVEQHYMDRLSGDVEVLRSAVDDIKQSTTAVRADAAAASADGQEYGDEVRADNSVDDPLTAFEDRLREEGLNPGKFDFWLDDQYGSLQVEKDGYLDDDEFSQWQDLTEDLGMSWSQQDEVNYLQSSDFEVLA